jgi:hypothetical protein
MKVKELTCPNCGWPIGVKSAAIVMGAKGEKATGKRKARTQAQARSAALARWNKVLDAQRKEAAQPLLADAPISSVSLKSAPPIARFATAASARGGRSRSRRVSEGRNVVGPQMDELLEP